MTANRTESPETLGQKLSANVPDSSGQRGWAPLSGCPPLYRADSRDAADRSTPKWLAEKINTSRRAARPAPCPKCGADTLTGPDHDTSSLTARVDPTPADPIAEVIALLAGRASYDLIGAELHHRAPEHHHSPTRRHPVLLEHTCTETRLF